MIKLNEEAILKKADEVRDNKANAMELFNLIGGDELERIFEKGAISTILSTLVHEKKTHSLYEDDENGLTELEGLLNKKITGKLGKFYVIKPEYIMSLSPEEQVHMAESVSEGNINLKNALIELWKNGIKTRACGGVRSTQKEVPYIYAVVPLEESSKLERLNNIVNKEGNYLDSCNTLGKGEVHIVIKGESIYQDIVEEFQKEEPKKNIVGALAEEQLLTYRLLKNQTENSSKYKYTDEDVEEIILNTAQEHKEQANKNEALLREKYEKEIRELSSKLEELQKENKELSSDLEEEKEENGKLQQKYDKLYETHGRLKNFVVHRIGKIPFLGRRILKMMENEVKVLPEGDSQVDNSEVDTGR